MSDRDRRRRKRTTSQMDNIANRQHCKRTTSQTDNVANGRRHKQTTSQTDNVANRQQVVRCKIAALPTAGPPPRRIVTTAYDGRKRKRTTYCKARHDAGADDGFGEEVGKEVDDRVDGGDGVGICVGVDVNGKGGRLTSWGSGVPPSLSEPHDPPYPTQPYATKPSQFHDSKNPNTTPYKFPIVGAGDGAMGRGVPCQGHCTTVRLYDVRRTTGTAHDVRQYDMVTHAE